MTGGLLEPDALRSFAVSAPSSRSFTIAPRLR